MSFDDSSAIEDLPEQNKTNDGWILELETALLSDCDVNVIRKISDKNLIPASLRFEFWQVCLGIKGRTKVWSDIFDLPEQNLIRQDVQKLVDKLDNTSPERLSIQSDIESIITNFSRLNSSPYESENGWMELLETLIHLNVKRDELFKVFETIEVRYIPKQYNSSKQINSNQQSLVKSSYYQPFHLLRLLLLYHDPELCNYFDTIKLTPDLFASKWFRSLFCSLCNHQVSLTLLDTYFTYANPFMIFFLSLVMIINLKDELNSKKGENKDDIISTLKMIPSSLCEADIKDMFFIAEQHFLNKTPSSISDFQRLLFQVYPLTDIHTDLYYIRDLSSFLCFPLSASELLSSCQNQTGLSYFVVDCRLPDQYNNGHLSTAFHLDCSLMLNDPSAFSTAVNALLASKQQALEANSVASGEHLCFMGSGREDEDCYVNMVVSSFLQKHHKFVSLLYGGYEALHKHIVDNFCEQYLTDHNPKKCLMCHQTGHSKQAEMSKKAKDVDQLTSVFIQKFSNVVKPKFAEMKEKIVEYVASPNQKPVVVKHVSSGDKLGKRYKGSKFSLDDSLADFDEEEVTETIKVDDRNEINLDEWKRQIDPIGYFQCTKINADDSQTPGFLALTSDTLYIIKQSTTKSGYGTILVKRPLEMVIQITSKRKCPEIITFKYGHTTQDNETVPIAKDSLILAEQFKVIRLIKHQVVNLLDAQNPAD